jgi:RES domain-containing protein
VTVRISKVKPASAATVIDLHIVKRARAAAISNALGADAIEDAVKLRLIDFEGIVVTLEIRVIVEIEGQCLVDLQRREVRERTFVTQPQDPGEEARRCFLVTRGHDRMVEHDSHRHLLAGAPVVASEIRRCVADFKARRAHRR